MIYQESFVALSGFLVDKFTDLVIFVYKNFCICVFILSEKRQNFVFLTMIRKENLYVLDPFHIKNGEAQYGFALIKINKKQRGICR